MNSTALIYVFCVLFGVLKATKIQEYGNVKNQKLIDRESVYAVADPNDYVQKAFTFPPVEYNFF